MKLLRTLLSQPATRPSAIEHDQPHDDDGARDDPTCGWHDSSHDLKVGLEVIELDPCAGWPDTLPIAWPLDRVASSPAAAR